MSKNDMRVKLIETVKHLLSDTDNPAALTSRAIGAAANVNPAVINYYFGSKDALVSTAIEEQIADAAERFRAAPADGTPALKRLHTMLWELTEQVIHYQPFTQTALSYTLLHGTIETPRYILPLIREHFGNQKDETECRVLAHVLLSYLVLLYFREDAFAQYAGIDLRKREERKRLLDILLHLFFEGDTYGSDQLSE
ncbi:TetR/AcrR family transcriptional regulator [Ethanoligenens sp.]|uniref:TetR/AcrR family transcriptional regulator n=1 Tax=Ethanoligenens sp. TaxID=2099655 RepID=UPI0039E72BDB